MTLVYERDPARIYAESFATIEREAALDHLSPQDRPLAIRLIHACGMVEVANDLLITDGAMAAGQNALAQGRPIFCDAEMVAHGIIRRRLPAAVQVRVTLNDPDTPTRAETMGTTRSAAAVEAWVPDLKGGIVAIGNAPTALFHLLDGLTNRGWPKPALILGFPVGFVGAAESKAALTDLPHGVPHATLPGRRGGSAMAAAAVNALSLGLNGDGT
ncbi:MAG: precorrin-8X methylmutase [Pseudomonadota bacterium]